VERGEGIKKLRRRIEEKIRHFPDEKIVELGKKILDAEVEIPENKDQKKCNNK